MPAPMPFATPRRLADGAACCCMSFASIGNTAEARIACPLMPVKSSASLPIPHPMKATLVASTRNSPSENKNPHQKAKRHALPIASHPKIAAAAGSMTTVSPNMVICAQEIKKYQMCLPASLFELPIRGRPCERHECLCRLYDEMASCGLSKARSRRYATAKTNYQPIYSEFASRLVDAIQMPGPQCRKPDCNYVTEDDSEKMTAHRFVKIYVAPMACHVGTKHDQHARLQSHQGLLQPSCNLSVP